MKLICIPINRASHLHSSRIFGLSESPKLNASPMCKVLHTLLTVTIKTPSNKSNHI